MKFFMTFFSLSFLMLFSLNVAQAESVTKGLDLPENLEVASILNKRNSQIIHFTTVCFPDGYDDAKRCYDHLDTLHLLSNDNVSIIGSCEKNVFCSGGDMGTKLKAKVIIIN